MLEKSWGLIMVWSSPAILFEVAEKVLGLGFRAKKVLGLGFLNHDFVRKVSFTSSHRRRQLYL